MGSLSISRTCTHSALQACFSSQSSRKIETRHRSSAEGFQQGRTIPFLVTPISSSSEQKHLTGLPALHIERMPLERSSLYRANDKLMLRTVRAEKEPTEQAEEEPEKTSPDAPQLWISRARSIQTTAGIFSSTMLWVVLFFMASIWDGENFSGKGPWERGSRK